ncbi:MAG: FtsX-like permease family protein [Enterococcus viikkiensis]|uniref:ABC transporter permease n=1 Tax=Enterococcus viikkiensis TaxID=930854 RepID=A0ABU3FTF5_9ENTE|nr:ABC transporter permease [Enterococcus viikkiensis]MDT2828923.1 ABC transporter permease [Enterococcus viikkiensis]
MLLKLSLTGIKGRLRDYVVLFSGLVMASAIFYMFESLATNEVFLQQNSLVSSVVFIFHLGTVLLSIITFVYILYANSFLMTMRQKDYGMFMMLGAKGRKIAELIFVETFVVGVAATIVGILLGLGLTTIVEKLLTKQLEIAITHFSAVNGKAIAITLIFFAIIFLLAAVVNATTIVKKPVLSILKASETPAPAKRKKVTLFFEAVFGIALLAIGYVMMTLVMKLAFVALVIALITIVAGTYFFFHAVLIFILNLLKQTDSLALKGLNNFTFSQLSFRIQDYTRILSLVAMLFALALGAITVGLGFRNEIPKMTNQTAVYDLVLNNSQKIAADKIEGLNPTLNATYQQKETDTTVYYDKTEFNQTPLENKEFTGSRNTKTVRYSGEELAKDVTKVDALRQLELPEQKTKEHQFVSPAEFSAVQGKKSSLQVVKVNDFMAEKKALQKLATQNDKNNPTLVQGDNFTQKTAVYNTFNSLFSGFEFMGFFLGIAFLTMLASCLMFKILSGAKSDVQRYTMLEKIGTRRQLLTASIRKEIGVLFLVPGLLGVIHVLFGLKMFTSLLSEPYSNIWVPFLIFFVLYFVYYVLTIWIYTGIVMKREA